MGTTPRYATLIGGSEAFLQVTAKIPALAASDATVLISGETGTGKELFALAIHNHSPRKGRPFIPVNCGALPDQLLENELFGHVKGAFTDASSPGLGLLAEAEGGTLLLDEIDSLRPSAQAKLLRFLQDREYRPLGSSKSLKADVRIIAASNADLKRQVQAGLLREDLYHRLNVLTLSIPPLRERLEDISLLAVHFLTRYGTQYGRGSLRLSPSAVQKLLAYHWPGNVRELEGVIQRAVILASTPVIEADHLDLPLSRERQAAGPDSFREAKARAIRQFERAYLTELLVASQGNVSRAAKAARMDRRAFQRLLRRHGLNRLDFQRALAEQRALS